MSDATPTDPSGTPPAPVEPGAEHGAEASASVGVVPEPGSHPVLRYTLARLGLLLAVAAVLYLVGLRQPLLLLAFAFLISGLIAMVALDRTREGAAYGITSAIRNANARIDASSRAEDVEPPAAEHQPQAAPTEPAPDHPQQAQPEKHGPPEPEQPAELDEWDDPAPR